MSLSLTTMSYEVKNSLAYIGFGFNEKKSMAVFNVATLTDLNTIADHLSANAEKEQIKAAIFFSHKEGCFIAGADISMISSIDSEKEGREGSEKGQQIFNKIEDLKIPTIACINGVCLGGGLEFAMSCSVRIASDSKKTSLGLPEVKLGILPGFGGTYRLPKFIALPDALDMMLTGKTVDGKKAKKLGLVQETYDSMTLLKMAETWIEKRDKVPDSGIKDTLQSLAMDNFFTRKIIFQKARETVLNKTKGFYPAPLKILDVVESTYGKSRTTSLAREAEAFGELCITPQSKNLQHIYFLTEYSKRYNGPVSGAPLKAIKTGGVLGAGTMGGGIAWLFADNNQKPYMKDLNKEALELGLKQAAQNFSGALKRKKMSQDEFERKQRSIKAVTNFDGFKQVDLIIEAIVENIDIKKKVFAETEKEVADDTIITSNTSSLSVEEMSKALEKPERFCGLHFFNPVHMMPLVEIITHSKVSAQTLESVHKWVTGVKKTPIIVKDGPGFLVNRILMPYLNEAAYLLEEGVSIEAIDKACLDFGMPMGPCRLMDEIGIDVGVKVGKIMYAALGERARACELSHKVSDLKCLGKKNGKGFYLYDENGKVGAINPEVTAILPTTPKVLDETAIQMRLFLPMINEAAQILDEKIVENASTVDLGLIYGIGFPPFKGGLLKYADSEGLDRILGALEKYAAEVNKDRYSPVPYLKKLVNDKKKFYDV
ncbi:MAG: 3-hydroxyacyl-CoA dehydrogenase NAD-binding domain-containing protein [Bacteriovoracaceae bacterium]